MQILGGKVANQISGAAIVLLIFTFLLQCSPYKQAATKAHQHVQVLASESFHGRGYQYDGHLLASQYIQQQLRKNGLSPAFNGSYTQPFEHSVNILDSAFLLWDSKPLIFGTDFLLHPSAASHHIIGKAIPLESYTPSSTRTVLPVAFEANLSKDQWENLSYALPQIKQTPDDLAGIFLVPKKLNHGISTSQSPLPAVFLSPELVKSNFTEHAFSLRSYSREEKVTSENIWAEIRGKSDSVILFTAHYDHLGQVNQAIFPGANDNASGVSMLLSLSKYFAKKKPEKTLVFLFTSAEELGLLGSVEATRNMPIDLGKIKFLINLDILGTGDDGVMVVNGSVYPEQFNNLQQINEDKKLLKEVRARGEACISDHCPFHMQEVPSFYIYTLGGVAHYHDVHDTHANLNMSYFPQIMELLVRFVESL
ncbi:MAG: M28 family peptidase [Weeksellaceae bacterium]|nr:M28 family peptidase [Weeksellaceae bacterium]